jgi:YHS domain-containing protein
MRLFSLLALGLLSLAVGCDKPAEVTQPPVQVLVGEGSADPAALAAMAQKKAPEASGEAGCGGEHAGSGSGCGGGDQMGCGGHEGSGCAGCGKHEGECTKGADGKCACAGCKGCGGGEKGDCCGGADKGEHMGCGGGGEEAAAKPTGEHEEEEMEELENVPADKIKAQPGLTVGDITRCPVSGDVFRIKANSPKAVVDGKTYYVCCKRCVGKLEKNPTKFLSK